MDGFEATSTIRAKERFSGTHIPIVAVTAHAMTGDRDKCLAAGMDAYVSKPIRRTQLLDTITSLGANRRLGTAIPSSDSGMMPVRSSDDELLS
jgi:CheY-like chemotaxis protein